MSIRYGFELDRFQLEGNSAVDEDRNVLVAAPTSSGKTVVAEHAIDASLRADGRAFYTAPIKALSNQKFRDFGRLLGAEQVGLMTGDQVINPDAPVVVMTTEVLRNMLYSKSESLLRLRWVVLDEVHFLEDPYRGAVWEEVILNLAPKVGIVALSATVSNAAELGDWLEAVRGPTEVVVEKQRPVRLRSRYLVTERRSRGKPRRLHSASLDKGAEGYAAAGRFDVANTRRTQGSRRVPWTTPRRTEVLDLLIEQRLLPAIHFVFSRAGCDEARDALVRSGVNLNDSKSAKAIETHVRNRLVDVSEADSAALGVNSWIAGLKRGIAAHHAGLIPVFKEITEELFALGYLKVVYATETLALGVNLPARSVVIDRMTKFTGQTHEILTPGQFTQLTGRAGRRGLDDEGQALVCWSPFLKFSDVAKLAGSRDFVLRSAFYPTYNMVANLVATRSEAEAVDVLARSFGQFQLDRQEVERGQRIAELRREVARLGHPDAPSIGDSGSALVPGSSLSPGSVLRTDAGLLSVVLSVGQRKGSRLRLRVLSEKGEAKVFSCEEAQSFEVLRQLVELPTPCIPDDEDVRAVALLELAKLKSSGRSIASNSHWDSKRQRLNRLERKMRSLEKAAGSAGQSLVARFGAARSVLERREILDGWSLTGKGQILRGIHHEADLLIAEALEVGLFDDLEPTMVASLVSCLTYRKRGPGASPRCGLGGAFPELFESLLALAASIGAVELDVGLEPRETPDAGFAERIYAWSNGVGLEVVLDENMPGGEFVRNVRLVVDLLRQLAAVADPNVAATARSAELLLDRDLVALSAGRLFDLPVGLTPGKGNL